VSQVRATLDLMLTETERAVLDFEARTYRYLGAKEADVRRAFRWSLTRHAQVVTALVQRPDALAYAPMTVRRLQRLTDARRRARSAIR